MRQAAAFLSLTLEERCFVVFLRDIFENRNGTPASLDGRQAGKSSRCERESAIWVALASLWRHSVTLIRRSVPLTLGKALTAKTKAKGKVQKGKRQKSRKETSF
jgi:hypothetical protein